MLTFNRNLSLPVLALAVAILGTAGCTQKAPENAASTKSNAPKPTRVAVKRGMDPDMKDVNMTPKDITVEDLIAMNRPEGLSDDISSPDFQEKRVGELEHQVWRLKGKIKSIIKRKDGDYYMVVEGKSGQTTVVEVPDPSLCKGSAVEKEISDSRSTLEQKYHPNDKSQDVGEEATIEGLGFWGQKPKAGSKGAPNGARIMPGTNVHLGK